MKKHIAELNGKKLLAVDLIIQGLTDREVAERLDVNASTVWRWRTECPAVIAEINRRRDELFSATAERFRGLVPQALDVLARELNTEGRGALQAAQIVLRMAGVDAQRNRSFDVGHHGPTNPQTIVEQRTKAESERLKWEEAEREAELRRAGRIAHERMLDEMLYPLAHEQST